MHLSFTERVLHPPAIGLDISDLTIKFARVLRTRNGPTLGVWGEFSIPEGLIEAGTIRRADDLARLLKEGLKGASSPIRERVAVASLPEEKSFLRVLDLPPMPPSDIPKAMRWEVEGAVPLPIDDVLFDYETLPSATPDSPPEVLLTAFPKEIVEGYVHALRVAGLTPIALELESQAITRALLLPDERSNPLIIADLGMNRTSFIIVAEGAPIFTKSVAIGGKAFEQAIMQASKVDQNEARRMKIEIGLSRRAEEGVVYTALAPLLETLAKEIEEQIWFSEHQPILAKRPLHTIGRVILCGGDANLLGIERFFAERIHVPVALGNPFANFHFAESVIPPIPRTDALKYTTTMGLALRAAGYH